MEGCRVVTGEVIQSVRLANGLPVYVLERPGFQKKYAVYSVGYGSLDENFQSSEEGMVHSPAGIAHFLEHKLFEKEDGNVFDEFSKFGASVNAFTSHTMTSYLFSTTDSFTDSLKELLRFVHNPYLTTENVEKEKGIIEQELMMYADHPDRRIHHNLLGGMYHNHPVRNDIGGTPQSVRDITVEWLQKCYQAFYHPGNMILFVAGDVQAEEVFAVAREYLGGIKPFEKYQRVMPPEPDGVKDSWVEESLSITRPRYVLGFKHKPLSGTALLKHQLTAGLAWRMIAAKSSPIYEKLYADGLVDDSFGASVNGTPHYSYSIVGTDTDHPKQLHEELFSAVGKLRAKGVDQQDLERLKRRAYGGHLSAFNSTEYIANSFIAHETNTTSLLDFLPTLQEITTEDVNTVIQEAFDYNNATVSVLWPENN